MDQNYINLILGILCGVTTLLLAILTRWGSRLEDRVDGMEVNTSKLAAAALEASTKINAQVQQQISEINTTMGTNYVPRIELNDRFEKIDEKQERSNDKLDRIIATLAGMK